jgi:predicted RNA-binding Zn-ribbon protein involved in translation (DUF1610 family)
MNFKLRHVGVAVGVSLYVTLGWVAGLVLVALAVRRNLRRLFRMRRALAPTIACTWCSANVSQYGAFECLRCHARTAGWAWRCATCSAWAGHMECPSCGLSVGNPLLSS